MFNQDEIRAIIKKIDSVQHHVPSGLTNREYILVALACIDQAGAKAAVFDEVLQTLEEVDVWEEDETVKTAS